MVFRTIVMASLLLTHMVSCAMALTITASSKTAGLSGFSIIYDDVDSDYLLSLTELVSFSGFTDNNGADTYDTLLFVPDIYRISTASGVPGFGATNFTVSGTGTAGYAPTNWTYDVTTSANVPLPPSVTLLLIALGTVALAARRRGMKTDRSITSPTA